MGAAENSGRRDANGVGAAERDGRGVSTRVSHRGASSGHVLSIGLQHFASSQIFVITAQRANSGLQHGPFIGGREGIAVPAPHTGTPTAHSINPGIQHSGRNVGATVASAPPSQRGASGGHIFSVGLQHVAVGQTLRNSGPQASFSGLQHGPTGSVLFVAPPHKGNPIGHTFSAGLQQRAVIQILVMSAHRCVAGSQQPPAESHVGNPGGQEFSARLQQLVLAQILVKSSQRCLAGSQQISVGGGKGVKSDGGGGGGNEGTVDGADDSHVGNPVGHWFKRVLQQLTPGQRRLKSEQDCLDGSQHVGADVIVGVPQIGTPVGHFVRAGLQQNTEGS